MGKGKRRTADAAPRTVEEALDDLFDVAPEVEVAATELERERVRDALDEQAALFLLLRAELRLPRLLLHDDLRRGGRRRGGRGGGVREDGVVAGVGRRWRGGRPRGGFFGGAQGGEGGGGVFFCAACCEGEGCGGRGLGVVGQSAVAAYDADFGCERTSYSGDLQRLILMFCDRSDRGVLIVFIHFPSLPQFACGGI